MRYDADSNDIICDDSLLVSVCWVAEVELNKKQKQKQRKEKKNHSLEKAI